MSAQNPLESAKLLEKSKKAETAAAPGTSVAAAPITAAASVTSTTPAANNQPTKDKVAAPTGLTVLQAKSIGVIELATLIGEHVNTADLAAYFRATRFSYHTYKEMLERKEVSEKLLPHVFNADPAKVEAFLARDPANKKKILTQTHYQGGYFSNAQGKFIPFEEQRFQKVSALQAAALCGDHFLMLRLLRVLLSEELSTGNTEKGSLQLAAEQQLQAVYSRRAVRPETLTKEAATAASMTTTAAKPPVATTSAAAALTSAGAEPTATTVAATTSAAATAAATLTATTTAASNKDANNKETAEQSKTKTASTKIKFADSAEYLAPIKRLLEAYDNLITQFPKLSRSYQWKELDRLLGIVGECQKRLYRYVLQEICGPIPFDPELPAFDTEPNRSECKDCNNRVLDLDAFGIGTGYGLCKWSAQACSGPIGFADGWWVAKATIADSAALDYLCKLREAGLSNTIAALESPERARTLLQVIAAASLKL